MAKFLNYCAKKYRPILTEAEAEECNKLMNRLSVAIDKIEKVIDLPLRMLSDENLQKKKSDTDFTVPKTKNYISESCKPSNEIILRKHGSVC
jgi:hypothetical protein